MKADKTNNATGDYINLQGGVIYITEPLVIDRDNVTIDGRPQRKPTRYKLDSQGKVQKVTTNAKR